ncbi:putative potassium transporter 11 [Platanthera zijinensis]|uniref:Potassium transporter 11 n=1 Tax=Platanthera zijinensis TaxID=2320716 RepID=A0AAP0ATS3_9ASPA
MLFDALSTFVQLETMMEVYTDSEECANGMKSIYLLISDDGDETFSSSLNSIFPDRSSHHGGISTRSLALRSATASDEFDFLNRCKDAGVVHIFGNTMLVGNQLILRQQPRRTTPHGRRTPLATPASGRSLLSPSPEEGRSPALKKLSGAWEMGLGGESREHAWSGSS